MAYENGEWYTNKDNRLAARPGKQKLVEPAFAELCMRALNGTTASSYLEQASEKYGHPSQFALLISMTPSNAHYLKRMREYMKRKQVYECFAGRRATRPCPIQTGGTATMTLGHHPQASSSPASPGYSQNIGLGAANAIHSQHLAGKLGLSEQHTAEGGVWRRGQGRPKARLKAFKRKLTTVQHGSKNPFSRALIQQPH